MSLYDKIFPPKTLTLSNGKQVKKPRSQGAADRSGVCCHVRCLH